MSAHALVARGRAEAVADAYARRPRGAALRHRRDHRTRHLVTFVHLDRHAKRACLHRQHAQLARVGRLGAAAARRARSAAALDKTDEDVAAAGDLRSKLKNELDHV